MINNIKQKINNLIKNLFIHNNADTPINHSKISNTKNNNPEIDRLMSNLEEIIIKMREES